MTFEDKVSQAFKLLREEANQLASSVHRSGQSSGRMVCSVPRVQGDEVTLTYEHLVGSGQDEDWEVRDDFISTCGRLGFRAWADYHVTAKVETSLRQLFRDQSFPNRAEDIETVRQGTNLLNIAVRGLLKAIHAKMPQTGRSGRVSLTLLSVYDTTALVMACHYEDGQTSLAVTHDDFRTACADLSIEARRNAIGCMEIRIPLSQLTNHLP